MIYRSRTSSAPSAWIKTADYTRGGEAVCGLHHVYRGFTGCPAWAAEQPCSYCYLRTTFRTDPALRSGVAWGRLQADCGGCAAPTDGDECHQVACPSALDIAPARAAGARWLQRGPSCGTCSRACRGRGALLKEALTCERVTPMVLNAGELADSFGFSPEENPHIAMLLDLFSSAATNPHGHKVLLLTKCGLEAVRAHLDGRTPSPNVILSWSVGNCQEAELHWDLHDCLQSSHWAARNGWRVRLRLDPMSIVHAGGPGVPVPMLPRDHAYYLRCDRPELITLGTMRHRGGRVKSPDTERLEIYNWTIQGLREGGYRGPIGLCKETPSMIRQVLGIEPAEMRCNCLP